MINRCDGGAVLHLSASSRSTPAGLRPDTEVRAVGAIDPARRRLRPRQPHRADGLQATGSHLRAVVGDDELLYQAGITYVLRHAGVEVVTCASNTEDLARKTRAYHPDVVVADMHMPPSLSGEDSVEAARKIRSIDPRMAVLLLSEAPEERYALAVLGDQPEGFGYLVKARIRDTDDFTASVHRVARGGTAIDPSIVGRLAGSRQTQDPLDDLTNRERQVIALMAEGRSNRYIAEQLVVTVAGVERHITSIFAKLGLRSNTVDHRRVLAVLRYLGRG